MKNVIGLLLIVVGILGALYVGVWVCFIGGIIQVIEQVRAEHLEATQVAIGVARIVFAGLAAWIFGFIVAGSGFALLNSSPTRFRSSRRLF